MTTGMIPCLLAAMLVLGGCGTVAFKQGDGAADLQAARERCRQQTLEPMEQCLKAAGWSMVSVGDREMAPETPSALSTTATKATIEPSSTAVAAWWKMGGSAEDLHQVLAGCGMPTDRDCMERQGWQPLGVK